jgi:hypothetical protein
VWGAGRSMGNTVGRFQSLIRIIILLAEKVGKLEIQALCLDVSLSRCFTGFFSQQREVNRPNPKSMILVMVVRANFDKNGCEKD